MFDALLRNLSLRRSAAGIYYELRTLRQMLEVAFEREGLELPNVRRSRTSTQSSDIDTDVGFEINAMNEEDIARQVAEQLKRDRLSGKDTTTTWVEDPNR